MSANLHIALIQTDLHWEDKKANLKMLEEKIKGIKEPTQVVVLPEMFNTGFSMRPQVLAETMEGETIQWMKRVAAEKKIILTGSLIIKTNGNGDTHYFNRLIWMLPNGQFAFYDKRHRFGYAGEDKEFSAGTKRLIVSVNGWKINLLVCYDLRFPIWARQSEAGNPEYDILMYVANWPEKRSNAWKTLLAARAIENQCYVVGVNRIGKDGLGNNHKGDSMVVDPMGEIMLSLNDADSTGTASLDKKSLEAVREKLPFLRDADRFKILET